MRAILSAAAMLALAAPAAAMPLCLSTRVMADTLRTHYGQVLTTTAMRRDGMPIMIYANPATGDFTMVMVGPEASCVMTMGTDLEIIMRGDPA